MSELKILLRNFVLMFNHLHIEYIKLPTHRVSGHGFFTIELAIEDEGLSYLVVYSSARNVNMKPCSPCDYPYHEFCGYDEFFKDFLIYNTVCSNLVLTIRTGFSTIPEYSSTARSLFAYLHEKGIKYRAILPYVEHDVLLYDGLEDSKRFELFKKYTLSQSLSWYDFGFYHTADSRWYRILEKEYAFVYRYGYVDLLAGCKRKNRNIQAKLVYDFMSQALSDIPGLEICGSHWDVSGRHLYFWLGGYSDSYKLGSEWESRIVWLDFDGTLEEFRDVYFTYTSDVCCLNRYFFGLYNRNNFKLYDSIYNTRLEIIADYAPWDEVIPPQREEYLTKIANHWIREGWLHNAFPNNIEYTFYWEGLDVAGYELGDWLYIWLFVPSKLQEFKYKYKGPKPEDFQKFDIKNPGG